MTDLPAGARRLLDFIGKTEAPKGYDTVYANRMADMPKPLTTMTLGEVIADGPRRTKRFRSSAAGRYQFMTATLKDLKFSLGLTGTEMFDADLQDRLAMQLLKRRGFYEFCSGKMKLNAFALRLAQEWASLPVLEKVSGQHRTVAPGESFYAGDTLNKALVDPHEIVDVLLMVTADVEDTMKPREDEPADPLPPVPASGWVGWAVFIGVVLAAAAYLILWALGGAKP